MKRKFLSVLIAFSLLCPCVFLTSCGKTSQSQSVNEQTPSEIVRDYYTTEDNSEDQKQDFGWQSSSPAEYSKPNKENEEAATETGTEVSVTETGPEVPVTETGPEVPVTEASAIDEDGWYDSKEDVALYIHTYGKLPGNYITKKQAEKLGWSGGGLEDYAPGKSIGGSYFGNYEGILPAGHNYTECDIDTAGKKSRGAKRIVFSDDGLIYYTDDHYQTFELLYGEE